MKHDVPDESAAEKCPDCRVCALCNHAHDLLDCEDNEVPCAECPKGVCVDVYCICRIKSF